MKIEIEITGGKIEEAKKKGTPALNDVEYEVNEIFEKHLIAFMRELRRKGFYESRISTGSLEDSIDNAYEYEI